MIVELFGIDIASELYSIECFGHIDLQQLLTKVKTRTSELKKKEVFYRVPCQDCDAAYIEETGRSLQKRLTEHEYAVKINDRKNGRAVHAWDMDHRLHGLGSC